MICFLFLSAICGWKGIYILKTTGVLNFNGQQLLFNLKKIAVNIVEFVIFYAFVT